MGVRCANPGTGLTINRDGPDAVVENRRRLRPYLLASNLVPRSSDARLAGPTWACQKTPPKRQTFVTSRRFKGDCFLGFSDAASGDLGRFLPTAWWNRTLATLGADLHRCSHWA